MSLEEHALLILADLREKASYAAYLQRQQDEDTLSKTLNSVFGRFIAKNPQWKEALQNDATIPHDVKEFILTLGEKITRYTPLPEVKEGSSMNHEVKEKNNHLFIEEARKAILTKAMGCCLLPVEKGGGSNHIEKALREYIKENPNTRHAEDLKNFFILLDSSLSRKMLVKNYSALNALAERIGN